MIRGLRLPQIVDQTLSRAFDEVKQVIDLIRRSKVLDGNLVTGIVLAAGVTTPVAHGLGRAPIGFEVVRRRAQALVSDAQDSNATPDRTFSLVASADVTVDVWFF
jgi:hypothetical protein